MLLSEREAAVRVEPMSPIEQRRKLFDLEQANRTLPLVSRIVEDIVRVNREIRDLHDRAGQLARGGNREGAEKLQDRMQELDYERAEFRDELERIGCELKDAELGLVDFATRLDDRIVYLCWKRGEPEIAFWHEVPAGFRGRQPVKGAKFTS